MPIISATVLEEPQRSRGGRAHFVSKRVVHAVSLFRREIHCMLLDRISE